MFWLIVLLMFLGLLLILLEAVLPHAVSFLGGAACVATACWLIYHSYAATQGPGLCLFYIFLAACIAGATAWGAFRTGLRMMALQPQQGGGRRAAAAEERPGLGERVQAIQPLRPTGTVQWGQRRLPARCLLPEVELRAGEWGRVAGQDSIYLLVEPCPEGGGKNDGQG